MSRTYRNSKERPWSRTRSQEFRCRHCRKFVGPLPSGGRHRNHCPSCLFSRHVDGESPGDRAATCGGSMAPAGAHTRRNGEYVILHLCLECGQERYNRIAADDDFVLVLRLQRVKPRARRHSKEDWELDRIA